MSAHFNEVIQPDLNNVRKWRVESLVNNLEFITKKLTLIGPWHSMYLEYAGKYTDTIKEIEIQSAYMELDKIQ